MGIIPSVVSHLLRQRKAKKKLKTETNENKVLDCFQLSYKLVANSVYGQTGAKTQVPVYFNKLAACTTSIGRQRFTMLKMALNYDGGKVLNGLLPMDVRQPTVIYGDLDSVFIKWQRFTKMGNFRR